MTEPVVEAAGLTKVYARGGRGWRAWFKGGRSSPQPRAAVDSLDLRVETGEIFGILGPNGAGKTTTLKMLSTLIEPTAGTARVLGIDLRQKPNDVRARIGVMLGGGGSVYWRLTGRENLEYFAALYLLDSRARRARVGAALDAVGLVDRADDLVERYSTGMRQRLALARALLPDAPLLILDEPTSGLDPQAARDFRARIRSFADRGRTILLSTHDMLEADALCDRIAIIDQGKLIALDSPQALKRRLSDENLVHLSVLGIDDPAALCRVADATMVRAEQREGTQHLTLRGMPAQDALVRVIDAVRASGGSVVEIAVTPVTLEDVFLALAGRPLSDR